MNTVVLAFGVAVVMSVVLAVLVVRRTWALRRRQRSVLAPAPAPAPSVSSLLAGRGAARLARVVAVVVSGPRWLAPSLAFGVVASAGYVLGGVVSAVALGVYGTAGVVFLRRRAASVARRAARSASLDRLTGLAADLRAGLPMSAAGLDGADGSVALARAAVALAERTGAPLADLVDRIEADARAGDRARAAAAAQAAGAQATAFLLAALPLGGLALGFAIGADPLAILLRTPLGAVCALGALTLQMLGLAWSRRLQPRLT
jgi:tight adherence protein B